VELAAEEVKAAAEACGAKVEAAAEEVERGAGACFSRPVF